MPPGGSTPRNIVNGDVPRKPPRRIFERSREKLSPENLEWERRVAAFEDAMQEQEQKQKTAASTVGSLSFKVCHYPYFGISEGYHVEDGERTWNDISNIGSTLTPPLLKDSTQQGEGRPLKDSAKSPDDTDFLKETNFFKKNSQKATTRNKRSSKKQKKKKGKGKARKQSHASEMNSDEPSTEPSSTCCAAATAGGKTLEYSSSSSSSHVTAKLIINPAINSASSGNEKDQLSASSSNDDFKSFKSTTSYATAASSSMNGYASSLSDAKSERSLSASDYTNSRGFNKNTSGEGNKPNVHQSLSLAISPGCSQEALLCTDYAVNDGDFQKVVSRKSAQKMKKMQRQERLSSSSTKAASGPIITHELVPRAPSREVITIGHYINDDTFYARKPNQKKGKYQKARSLSNLSKTGYTDGDNVSGSNRMHLIATVHQAKPSSSHHVTLEAIEETNSPSCLPKEKELNAMDRVDDGTEDIRAPSSDYPSSLGHPDNPSCIDRKEQIKDMALVGGDTDDKDSRAEISDKTLSSLCHLAISSRAHSEDQKKEENSIAIISSHASSEFDKIIRAANNAYEIQAASDVYMTSGIHADIENFLHAATPVICQISCTKSNITLQDQRLWSVWSWYEEPECCGIEVLMQGKTNSIWPEFSTYFRPLLSAVQLFGQSGKSQNHGGLVFEYFETETPFLRPPIFTRIKQLRDGSVNLLPGVSIFGDPKQLESVKLSDLHPASWYA